MSEVTPRALTPGIYVRLPQAMLKTIDEAVKVGPSATRSAEIRQLIADGLRAREREQAVR